MRYTGRATHRLATFTAFAALALAIGQSAQAQVTVSETAAPSGGNYLYSYTVTTASTGHFDNGGVLTIYDIQGYVPGSITAPAGFTSTAQTLGINPSGTVPLTDSSTVFNLSFTNTGADIGSSQTLGPFTALSSLPGSTNQYAFQAIAFPTGNLSHYYSASSAVSATASTSVVPESSGLANMSGALLALALAGVVMAVKKKQAKAA